MPDNWEPDQAGQSNREDEALLEAYFERRKMLEGAFSAEVTAKHRKNAWDEVMAAVNGSDDRKRDLEQTKNRYKNMMKAYKQYQTEIKEPPTGGGRPPERKPFFDILDRFLADDSRIVGVGNEKWELGLGVPSDSDTNDGNLAATVGGTLEATSGTSAAIAAKLAKPRPKFTFPSISPSSSSLALADTKESHLLFSPEHLLFSPMQIDENDKKSPPPSRKTSAETPILSQLTTMSKKAAIGGKGTKRKPADFGIFPMGSSMGGSRFDFAEGVSSTNALRAEALKKEMEKLDLEKEVLLLQKEYLKMKIETEKMKKNVGFYLEEHDAPTE